jgi:hypothetical protein
MPAGIPAAVRELRRGRPERPPVPDGAVGGRRPARDADTTEDRAGV